MSNIVELFSDAFVFDDFRKPGCVFRQNEITETNIKKTEKHATTCSRLMKVY